VESIGPSYLLGSEKALPAHEEMYAVLNDWSPSNVEASPPLRWKRGLYQKSVTHPSPSVPTGHQTIMEIESRISEKGRV